MVITGLQLFERLHDRQDIDAALVDGLCARAARTWVVMVLRSAAMVLFGRVQVDPGAEIGWETRIIHAVPPIRHGARPPRIRSGRHF
jgi:hypothetical protein